MAVVLTEDWLMVVATILVVWLTLEALAYRRRAVRRAETEPREGFAGWLAVRIRWNWPLLVLLIVCGTEFAWVEGRWVLVGAAVVVAWWVAEAIGVRPMPRTRDPLWAFSVAMRGLWRNRGLLVALVACWVASALVSHLFYIRSYRQWTEQGAVLRPLSDRGPGPGDAREKSPPDITAGGGVGGSQPSSVVESVKVLPTTLSRHLPKVESISFGFLGEYLLLPALAVVLVWLVVKKPPRLPLARRGGLRWPLNLTVACFLLQIAYLPALVLSPASRTAPTPSWLWHVVGNLSFPVAAVLSAPLGALLWHIGLQVARGERWSLPRALQGMAASWAPICILQFVVCLPTSIMLLLGGTSLPLHDVGTVLKVALALGPWIIVDQAVGFRQALVETYRLVSGHAYDLLVFALRFTAMFGVASVLLGLLQPRGLHPPTPVEMIGYATGDFLTTAQALVIAVLYLELRRERDPVEDAAAPVAGAVPQ
jgi:hypothetical protein